MKVDKKKPKRETVNVSYRLEVGVHAKLEERAALARMSARAYLERAVLSDQTKLVLPRDEEVIRALLFQVSRAGNNLNQLAHKLNYLDKAGQLGGSAVDEALEKLDHLSLLMQRALDRAR